MSNSPDFAHSKIAKADDFQSPDFYQLDDLLTEEHKLIRSALRDFVKKEITPFVEGWAQSNHFPRGIVSKFGEIGAFGPTLPEKYGCGGLDYISYGLIMQEIERGDSGMRSTASVQGSLVMYPIYKFGTEAQRKKYLPRLTSGELLGCFGLTEPDFGSNPSGLVTNFQDAGDHYLLNGAKMWISNSPDADIAVVWAKDQHGRIHGLIAERGMEGFTAPETHGKWSLRASCTGELVFDNVKIPKENLLTGMSGLRAPMMCLDSARYGISWGVVGAAMDCYESARKYALERIQFGKPIASFQLTQKKLAEMLTEITKVQLLNLRLGQLMNAGTVTSSQISLAKRNNVEIALKIAREARQIHGGMGITGEYPIMRHMMNLESVITYEGTHDIHLLILGKEITGIPAFE